MIVNEAGSAVDAARNGRPRTPGSRAGPVRYGVRCRLRILMGLRLLVAARGRRVASIRAVAASAKVHRNTVAAVYRDLERFGLVRCVHGAGTFATRPLDLRASGREPPYAPTDLADVVAAELGRPVRARGARGPADDAGDARGTCGPLLLPLDETPPAGRAVFPLAPSGRGLTALRALRPGSIVHLVSGSARLGRLLRNTILSLHGDAVGLARLPADGWPPTGPRPDLGLVDALELRRDGTPGDAGVFFPLSLLGGDAFAAG